MDPKFTGKIIKTLADALNGMGHALPADQRREIATKAREAITAAIAEHQPKDEGARLASGAQAATGFVNNALQLLGQAVATGAKHEHFDALDALRQQAKPAAATA